MAGNDSFLTLSCRLNQVRRQSNSAPTRQEPYGNTYLYFCFDINILFQRSPAGGGRQFRDYLPRTECSAGRMILTNVGSKRRQRLASTATICDDTRRFCQRVPSRHPRPRRACPRSMACASSRRRPAIRASCAPPPSSASPRPRSHTASARWSSISTSPCSTAAIAAYASTAAAGPISRRCSASLPRCTASPNASAAGRAGSRSCRSRRSPRSGCCPGSPPSRRTIPTSPSSWRQPPRRRSDAARLRRLAGLHRRDRGAAPAAAARGHAAGGDALRGESASGLQPGPARRAGPAARTGRPAPLAPALRSGLGRRLVILVRSSARARARPGAGLRFPPLQHAGAGRGERHRSRHRAPHADRARLERRTLVPLFKCQAEAPERCCLITTAASRRRLEVQAFRKWILGEARTAARPATDGDGRPR